MEVTQELLLQSDVETHKHIHEVSKNIWKLIVELGKRAELHDASKFEEPERTIYASGLPLLGKTEYGSEEYKELLNKVKPAVDHHWAHNRHHPEHWAGGINEMDLIDILEMIADWMAATKRNKNGNIHRSIDMNTQRFGMSPQLVALLKNTVNRYF